jgi:hypothetical protein
MVQIVTPDSPIALTVLSQIQAYLSQFGLTADVARSESILLLYQYVSQRAAITAFEMDYVIGALIILVGIIPAMFLPYGKVKKAGPVVDMG